LTLSPPNGELPIGASAQFVADGPIPPLPLNEKAQATVICGPDARQSQQVTVQTYGNSPSPGVPMAYFTITNQGGAGTDLISVTVGSGADKVGPATISVTWAPPVDCGQPLQDLGYLLALQCTVAKAKPLVDTVLKVGDCAVGVASFLAPAAKLAKLVSLVKTAGSAETAEKLAAVAAVNTPVAQFALDLKRINDKGIISFRQLASTLEDAKDLADFLRNFAHLLGNIASSVDVSGIALDVANLTGLGSCVELLAKVVTYGAPVITSTQLPAGIVGQLYTTTLTTADHRAGVWTITSGQLPAGLRLSGYTIVGTPTTAGTANFTLQFTDTFHRRATAATAIAVSPVSLAPSVAVAAGNGSTCALLPGGTVKCWGLNNAGQLGIGSHTGPDTCGNSEPCSLTPELVKGITDATAIAVGNSFACAIVGGGGVKCWGDDSNGELGNGDLRASDTPVSVQGLSGVTQISAGNDQACAILSDGGVDCWGENEVGEVGNGTTTDQDVPVPVTLTDTAKAAAAGDYYTCALLSDGFTECWGDNDLGQLGNGTTINSPVPVLGGATGAAAISAGSNGPCATLSDGSVDCWGDDGSGELATPPQSAPNGCPGNQPSPCSWNPFGITGLPATQSTAGGGAFNCALATVGTIHCWGKGDVGELGNGQSDSSYAPVPVSGIDTATAVSAGLANHACAVLKDGSIHCWGDNSYGELGNGSGGQPGDFVDTPVEVTGLN
jgi:alpha-tubulin suppressor-like RCC1 family protein